MGREATDGAGRDRLIDAAISCFAVSGFTVSVRTIAERAEVTAGLIRHHFGSKDALRDACDAEVLRRYRELKMRSLEKQPVSMFSYLAGDDSGGTILMYSVRSIASGGTHARVFFEHFVDESREIMRAAVADELVKPSRDEEARVRQLMAMSLGAFVVQFALLADLDSAQPGEVLDRVMHVDTLPLLELFTEGVFTDTRYLDAYLAYTQGGQSDDSSD